MKADMLDSATVTFENAAGAVMTNCLFGAYAVGDVKEIEETIDRHLHIKKIGQPRKELTDFYRSQYELKNRLVKVELAKAFETLKEIR
jgi:xylulokinase